jgi:hypothetical protein
MRRLISSLMALAICVAVVPLPPKRGDGHKVRYVPVIDRRAS